jgi:hypothetical protein
MSEATALLSNYFHPPIQCCAHSISYDPQRKHGVVVINSEDEVAAQAVINAFCMIDPDVATITRSEALYNLDDIKRDELAVALMHFIGSTKRTPRAANVISLRDHRNTA